MTATLGCMAVPEEVLFAFPAPLERLPKVKRCRSTLLSSSLNAIRDRGLLERYLKSLPTQYHEMVVSTVAGVWLPIEVAMAHYRAMDALGLGVSEQVQIGRLVSDKFQGTVLGTLVKLATVAGATPWIPIGQFQRFWERLMDGGGSSAVKVGPKEARLELAGLSLFTIPYFRVAFRGVVAGACDLFTSKTYVYEIAHPTMDSNAAYRIAWV